MLAGDASVLLLLGDSGVLMARNHFKPDTPMGAQMGSSDVATDRMWSQHEHENNECVNASVTAIRNVKPTWF